VRTITGENMTVARSKLVEFIKELKSTDIMGFDEAKTKQMIVLRILDLLGWNIFDVDEVVPEYGVSNRRVDYSLVAGNNKVFLEVKKTGENLEGHQGQLLMYAFEEGVKLAILTNGIVWQFFLPLKEGKWEQRRFFTIDILRQNAEEVAQRFEDFLSKENVMSGVAINKAEEVLEIQKKQVVITETLPKAWNELISKPDERLVELLIDKTEKMCGYRPSKIEVIGFLERRVKLPLLNILTETPKNAYEAAESVTKTTKTTIDKGGDEYTCVPRILLREAVVKALGKLGGRAPRKIVHEKVYEILKECLEKPRCQEKLPSGEIRWKKDVDWTRDQLKIDGFIKPPEESGRGIWELTKKRLGVLQKN